MALSFNPFPAASHSVYKAANVHDLVTGSRKGLTTSLFGSNAQPKASSLSDAQKSTLTQLESFVTDNVKGPQADKLMASIAGLRQLMNGGSKDYTDPVTQLLKLNSNLAASFERGSVLNQLL